MRLIPSLLAVFCLGACGQKTIDCAETLSDYCAQHASVCANPTYSSFVAINCPAPAETGVFTGECHGYKIVRLESTGIFIAMFDKDSEQLVAIAQLDAIDSDFACSGGPESVNDPDCDLEDLTLTCGQNPDI